MTKQPREVTPIPTTTPQPSPDDEPQPEQPEQPGQQPPAGGWLYAVPGSVLDGVQVSGPVPAQVVAGRVGADGLDWQALIEALAVAGKVGSDPQGLDEVAAAAEGRMRPADPGRLAAVAVEHMPAGSALAGWLDVATAAAGRLNEDELTGVAVAAGTQAAHTQAAGLTAVAQLTARAAAADQNVGVEADGRPVRVTGDAAGQLEMALMLSHDGAQSLADLAVTLTWRLADTGAALAAGWIDLDHARLVAQYTSVLSQGKARQVEAQILPVARRMTRAKLRRRLTVLVIMADPAAAERRRTDAERHADVRLFTDDDQTATLMASKLPQVAAAAGYARINALARARKAAGLPGSIRHHRSCILLELMLGILDLTPPADGDPDQPLPPDDTPPPSDPQPHDPPPGPPPGPTSHPGNGSRAAPGNGPASGASHSAPGPAGDDSHRPDDSHRQDSDGHGREDSHGRDCGRGPGTAEEVPAPSDADAPEDDGLDDVTAGEPGRAWDRWEDDDLDDTRPLAWPKLGTIPPALARASHRDGGTPPAALLDVTMPWTTYARWDDKPATLSRIGAITAEQARQLTRTAEHDPAAQWRIIITDHDGHAITVTRLRLHRRTRTQRRSPPATGPLRAGPPRAGPPGTGPPGAGLAGRITLVISQDTVTQWQSGRHEGAGPPPLSPAAATALSTAATALQHAQQQADADAAAGGCAHTSGSARYRPPTRLREHVIARDHTCRNPVCGQPAWRADLDHTRPWDQGGPTCSCNLGGACRRDHQLKQHPRWKLQQTQPGWFRWTAPSGRTYHIGPEKYLA